jgi:hypothetical protein
MTTCSSSKKSAEYWDTTPSLENRKRSEHRARPFPAVADEIPDPHALAPIDDCRRARSAREIGTPRVASGSALPHGCTRSPSGDPYFALEFRWSAGGRRASICADASAWLTYRPCRRRRDQFEHPRQYH